MVKTPLILMLLAIVMLPSCAMMKKSAKYNYGREGFLTNNCFQVLVTIDPDKESVGLVEKRESAYLNVRNNDIKKEAKERLIHYCYSYLMENDRDARKLSKAEREQLKKSLENTIGSKFSRGYIEERYFNNDSAFVLVYRIRTRGLKKRIESLTLKEIM